MFTTVFRVSCFVLLVLAPVSAALAQAVPAALSYQGKLLDSSGQPVPDTDYDVQIKLYDVETGGREFWVSDRLRVQTSGGLFTAILEGGYPTLSKALSNKTDVWLETWVGHPLSVLSPRVRLVSAPFAFRAGDLTLPFAGTVSSASSAFSITNTGGGNAALFQVNDASTANYALSVTSNAAGSTFYSSASGGGHAIKGYTSGTGRAGSFQISNSENSSPAVYALTDGTGQAVYGYTSGTGDAVYGHTIGTGRAGVFTVSNSSSSSDAVYARHNGLGDTLRSNNYGSGNAVYAYSSGTGRAGYFQINNASSSSNALYVETNGVVAAFRATHLASGNFGYAGSPGSGLYGRAESAGGQGVYGTSTGAGGYGVYGYAGGANSYALYGYGGGTGGVGVYARAGSGGYAAVLRGNVQIQDRASGASVIDLGTGLDYAEGFDVSDPDRIEPGAVLVIDPANPGKLALSTEPYDRKVAGIVAGARGLGSGVKLGAGQFEHSVALAGRVYCNVDAADAAVEVGDLLTSSATPGYAMKVTDHARAQGAIIGKAMEALDKGTKGQILVLVTLQ